MKRPLSIATALLTLFGPATFASDTEHIVPLPELHQRAVAATEQRQKNIEAMDDFLSVETVAKSLRSAKLDPGQLRHAVRMLSDEELAKLAQKARQVQSDFAAGSLTNQQLTYIVIALGTAVLILVILAA